MSKIDALRRLLLAAALGGALAATGASALAAEAARSARADGGALAVVLTVQRVELDAQGKETLVESAQVRPGDLLEYRAVYTNRGPKALTDVQATLPIPVTTAYQARTARPFGVTASAGADHAPEPLARKVRSADGKEKVEAVPYAEYRSLRWRIAAIDAGRSVAVSARVRIAGALAATTAAAPQIVATRSPAP